MTSKAKTLSELAIYGGTLIPMDGHTRSIPNAVIYVDQGKISKITSLKKKGEKPFAKKVLDATNCLVMPGFSNGHTHTGMTLLRGIADDLDLKEWLFQTIFPLERKWGNKEFVYMGTLLACLEMIKGGITLFNDMYYFEESAAKAVHESGMRGLLGQTLVEISGVESSQTIMEKFDEYVDDVKKYPLVQPVIAPHSIYGVTEKSWPYVIEYAKKHDLPIHVHLQETQGEVDECLKKFGKSPTEMFKSWGLWEQKAIAAHCVCLSDKDIQILGNHGVGVAHCPESNLKLETKISPVKQLREAGASVVLGTDGVASNNNLDLLEEIDIACKLQVYKSGVGALCTEDAVRILTIEGAKALGMDKHTGSIEVGKSADMIAIDLDVPHAQPMYDPYSHIVYSAQASDVKHSVVAGKILMKDRKVLTLDEAAILKEVKAWQKKISK